MIFTLERKAVGCRLFFQNLFLLLLFFCNASKTLAVSTIEGTIEKHPKKADSPESPTFNVVTLNSSLKSTKGLVIITHDLFENFDNQPFIHSLRIHLSQAGWKSASINMPQLHFRESDEDTATDVFKTQFTKALSSIINSEPLSEQQKIFIVCHGISCYWISAIAASVELNLFGIVMLSPYYPEVKRNQLLTDNTTKLGTYVLDIVSDNDNVWVTSEAKRRKRANSIKTKTYRQIKLINSPTKDSLSAQFIASRASGWMHAMAFPKKP